MAQQEATGTRTEVITPEEFRKRAYVDCDGTPRIYDEVLDDWQRQDCEAMDGAWKELAGIGHSDGIRTAWLERGKGSSKTTDEAIAVLWAIYAVPRKITGYGVASDKDQAKLLRDAIDTIIRLDHFHGNLRIGDRVEINKFEIINKETGSRCVILASDEAGSHGLLPDFVIADEVTHWKKREFWDAIYAGTGKRASCILVAICNAGVGIGISWQWFLRESFREDPTCYFRRLEPIPGVTPSWLTAEQLDKQQRRLPYQAFRRLWLNIWTAGEGDALDPEDIDAAITMPGPMLDASYHNRVRDAGLGVWRFIAGLDLGINHDHSALVILAVQYGVPRIRLAFCRSWKPPKGGKVNLIEVQQEVERVHNAFHLDKLFFDPHQAELMSQQLTRKNICCEPMTFVGKNLDIMATALLDTFRNRCIDLYKGCDDLVRHLRQLTIVEKEWGFKLESARTEDGHADTAIALGIALPHAVLMTHRQASMAQPIEAKLIRPAPNRATGYNRGKRPRI